MAPIRVLLCDDHQIVREGLRSFLELHDSVEIVGECANGVEVLQQIDASIPDVILLDLMMPRMSGLDVLRELQQREDAPKVLVLSSFLDDESVFAAIEVGADGYLLKDISPAELLKAIQDVSEGLSPLHPTIAQKLMRKLATPQKKQESRDVEELTEREQEVLGLVAQGLKNREVGQALCISPKTVKTHVSNILYKLGVKDRVQLVIWAHQRGIVGDKETK